MIFRRFPTTDHRSSQLATREKQRLLESLLGIPQGEIGVENDRRYVIFHDMGKLDIIETKISLAPFPQCRIQVIGIAIFASSLLRIGRVSVATHSRLWGPTGAYWGLLVPTMISVSTWLPVSSVLSACYCLDRRCVLKSLATSQLDRQLKQCFHNQDICIPVCCAQHSLHGKDFPLVSWQVLFLTSNSSEFEYRVQGDNLCWDHERLGMRWSCARKSHAWRNRRLRTEIALAGK